MDGRFWHAQAPARQGACRSRRGFFLGGGLRRLPRRCRGLGTSRSHKGSCTLAELMLAAGGGGGRCVWEGYVLEQRIFFA